MSSGYLLPIGTFAYNSATSFVLITMPDRYIEHDLRGFVRSSLPELPALFSVHEAPVWHPWTSSRLESFSHAQMKMPPRSPCILTRDAAPARICFYTCILHVSRDTRCKCKQNEMRELSIYFFLPLSHK